MSGSARLLLLLACAASVALGYAVAVPAGLVADDYVLWHGLEDGSSGLAAIGMRRGAPFLRPVLGATFWLEHRLLGVQPWHMHAVGMALHALAAYGLGRVVELWANARAGVVAALLFATLPIAPEAVTWVSARGYPLAAVAIVALLALTLRDVAAPRAQRSLGVGVLAAVALLSVEPAFPLAVFVACLSVRRLGWRVSGPVLAAGFATAAYLALRLWWVGGLGGYRDDGRHAQFDLGHTLAYLGQALGQLGAPGPWDGADGASARWLVGLEVVASVALACVAPWRRSGVRDGVALALCVGAALGITATWATLSADLSGVRYLYFAALFRCAALGQLAAAAPSGSRSRGATVAVVALVLAQLALLVLVNWRWRAAGDHAAAVLQGLRERVAAGAQHLVLFDVPAGERGVHVLPWAVDSAVRVAVSAQVRVDVLGDAAQFAAAQAMAQALPEEQRRAVAVGRWDAAARVWRWQ